MKSNNKRNTKILLLIFVMLLFSAIFTPIYAYKINYVVGKNENIKDSKGNPVYVYRKQVGAYKSAIESYNQINPHGGWRYKGLVSANKVTSAYKTTLETGSSDADSFIRIGEYFHRNQNSSYITEEPETTSTKRYFGTGTFTFTAPEQEPVAQVMGKRPFWGVWRESEYYSGLFDSNKTVNTANKDIVLLGNNAWREAIIDKVYITDNILTEDTVNKLWEKFGDLNTNTLNVWNSSVLKTTTSNNNTNAETQNMTKYMDTAYKFWQCTINGTRGGAWNNSPVTMGTDPLKSFVNYYDNTFEFPVPTGKEIYVRHIDVSGVSNVNSTNLPIDTGILNKNGQVLIATGWNGSTPTFSSTRLSLTLYTASTANDNQKTAKYDYYKINTPSANTYVVGNLKYNAGGNNKYLVGSDTFSSYNCVGVAFGKGNNYSEACINKNTTLDSGDFRKTFNINNNRNVTFSGTDKETCIVIDYFYEKTETKKVYVRHIDLTAEDGKINQTTVNRAINSEKVLNGTGS